MRVVAAHLQPDSTTVNRCVLAVRQLTIASHLRPLLPPSLLDSLSSYTLVSVSSSTHTFHSREQHTASYTSSPSSSSAPQDARAGAAHRAPRQHPPEHALEFQTEEGQRFEIQLRKNEGLFGAGYSESMQHWTSNGQRSPALEPRLRTANEIEHCHYQGVVTATGGSADVGAAGNVGISTCSGGFSGLILLKDSPAREGGVYGIEPAHLHVEKEKLEKHVQSLSTASGKTVDHLSMHILYDMRHHRSLHSLLGGSGCGVEHPDVVQSKASRYTASKQWAPHSQSASAAPSAASYERDHDSAFDILRHFGVVSGGDSDATHEDTASNSASSFGAKMRRPGQVKAAGDPINAQRYVELFIANDNRRYLTLQQDTESKTAEIVNQVATFYQTQNPPFTPALIQVVLIGQTTFFNSDPWNITTGGCTAAAPTEVCVDKLLSTWNEWRRNPDHTVPYQNHDTGHLFSGYKFQGAVLGYAGVGSMCDNTYAGGIDQMTSETSGFNAVIAAHEIGHNLGMQHDSSGNNCAQSGFIMNAVVDSTKAPKEFSSCSLVYYTDWTNTGAGTCLNNLPVQRYGAAVCGNGYVEAGEACDCGPYGIGVDSTNVAANFCQASSNPNLRCCDALSCQFVERAECSDTDACCSNCRITQASEQKVCRTARNSCDVAETCDGSSSECPFDDSVGNGAACTMQAYGAGTCFEGSCTSHAAQCGALSATVKAGPWYFCPYQQQYNDEHRNGATGGLCGTLWCSQQSPLTASGCSLFTLSSAPEQMADGNACGAEDETTKVPAPTSFCYKGQCVAASVTNPRYQWAVTDWEKCSDCNTQQARNVTCRRSSNNAVSLDVLCSGSDKPLTSQQCSDDELLCEQTIGGTIDLTILGRDIAVSSNVVIGVSVGIFVFLLFMVHVFVSCVKKRISDPGLKMVHDQELDQQQQQPPKKEHRKSKTSGRHHSAHGPRTHPQMSQAEQYRMAGLA
jgi:hypothetical protein